MLYQKILSDVKPYQLFIGPNSGFGEHRHGDLEFNYCVKGSFEVVIDKVCYRVSEGQMSLIGSGLSPSFPRTASKEHLVFTGILGASFLKSHFHRFSVSEFSSPILDLNGGTLRLRRLSETLRELMEIYSSDTEENQLLVTADLYKVCAYLLGELEERKGAPAAADSIAKVEKALEMIFYDYQLPLTVEEAAQATGYGKSNFCKQFKKITGTSFHQALNRRRIDVSRELLVHTDLPISEIAREVGYDETKTFCRLFRSEEDTTPGRYRKARREVFKTMQQRESALEREKKEEQYHENQ